MTDQESLPSRKKTSKPALPAAQVSGAALPHDIADAGEQRIEGKMRERMRTVLDQPFERLTVAQLAISLGVSRSAFAERFKRAFGEAPMAFLKRERLAQAARLLSQTEMPVKVIAGKVGFASRSSFTRAFRDAFGLAPHLARAAGQKATPSVDVTRDRVSDDAPDAYFRLRAICDIGLDVAWDIDLATGLVWWSEGMSRVFGYGPEHVGRDTAWCHDHIHPDDRARVVSGMTRACESSDSSWRDTFRYRRADGGYETVDDRGTIVRDAAGKAIRMLGAMRVLSDDSGVQGAAASWPRAVDARR